MGKIILNKHQQSQLIQFIESTNIDRLSNSLRVVLLEYIAISKDCLPIDFDLQLNDWNMLFDLLTKIKKDS